MLGLSIKTNLINMKKTIQFLKEYQLQICFVTSLLGFLSLSVHFFNLLEENKQLQKKILELRKQQVSLYKQTK
jgi:hypothetical protein